MKFIITIFLITIFQVGKVCDCLWQGPFLKLAEKSETVIVGKVVDYDVFVKTDDGELYPTVMIIEIQEIILPISNKSIIYSDSLKYFDEIFWTKRFNKGKVKTVRLLGNYGSSCRPDVTNFPINSTYLFALTLRHRKMYIYDIDFSISNCGTYWLPVENGIVKGNFYDEEKQQLESDGQNQEIELPEIKKQLLELR